MIYDLAQLAAKKLSLYLKRRVTPERFQSFTMVLDASTTADEVERMEEKLNAGTSAYAWIIKVTEENKIVRTCLELAVFSWLCPFAEEIFSDIIPGHGKAVSLQLAILTTEQSENAAVIADAYFTISKILMPQKLSEDIYKMRYYADFTLISILQGQYMPSPEMEPYISFLPKESDPEELILWKEDAIRLAGQVLSMPSAVSVIYGAEFSGRKFLSAYIAHKCGLGICMVDFTFFTDIQDPYVLSIRIRHVVRDCFLLGCALGVCNISESNETGHTKIIHIINRILAEFAFSALPVFLTAQPQLPLLPYLHTACLHFTIPKLNTAQSLMVWDYFGGYKCGLARECYADAAQKAILPVGKIRQAALQYSLQEGQKHSRRLLKLCHEYMDFGQYKGIKHIQPKYHWEDLKLAETQKNMLEQICCHAACKELILSQWGMDRFYAYGNCVSALFTGPPGTGKTMAAHVVADRLQLTLYQIDLSQILDKYIGETEKHLAQIFDLAEKGNTVLFLDEADALFGKRSDIQSSHDRYANQDISYILQRMEAFNGIILMATNLCHNIDPAFLRRVHYVVNFALPDQNIRRQIWSSFFQGSLPHDELDLEFLASDELALTGAEIKTVMMGAMVKAATDGKPLHMGHIASSVKELYLKMGRTDFSKKWKQYL